MRTKNPPLQPAELKERTNNGTLQADIRPVLNVAFYRSMSGTEPVLEWIRTLETQERKIVGEELRTVQLGWPLGMPLVRKMESGLWEVRVTLPNRIARILFTASRDEMILLHAFIKKSHQTPREELDVARKRMKDLWKPR